MTSSQFFSSEQNQKKHFPQSNWQDILSELNITPKKIRLKRLPKNMVLDNRRIPLDGEFSGAFLTVRQCMVLIEFLKGRSSKAVAVEFALSERTIEDYSKTLRDKLGFATKRDMVDKLNRLDYLNKLTRLKSTLKECTVKS
ncbi:MAG: LuxR C-terminal-related transcriptional regulator [Gammaproteobacteria bacterium]|nr:LuxR C-terminal-related transcriptional regulator [Gammaproteobacteria bacterium]